MVLPTDWISESFSSFLPDLEGSSKFSIFLFFFFLKNKFTNFFLGSSYKSCNCGCGGNDGSYLFPLLIGALFLATVFLNNQIIMAGKKRKKRDIDSTFTESKFWKSGISVVFTIFLFSFVEFFTTKIFREIKVGECRASKIAIKPI